MKKYITILLLVFSGASFSFSNDGKIELVCDGKASNYKDNVLDIRVEGSVVVVNFEENTVSITGDMGGKFTINKITNDRVSFFALSGELTFVGGINRYTGSVIVTNKWDESNDLLYHLKLNCKVAKRLF